MKLLWVFLFAWLVTLDTATSSLFFKPPPSQRSYKTRPGTGPGPSHGPPSSRPPRNNPHNHNHHHGPPHPHHHNHNHPSSHPPPHGFNHQNNNLHASHSMNHNQIVLNNNPLNRPPPPHHHGHKHHGPPPPHHGPPHHGHGRPPPPHHHHGRPPPPPKNFNSFPPPPPGPGRLFPKPSSSNMNRHRVRPPPHGPPMRPHGPPPHHHRGPPPGGPLGPPPGPPGPPQNLNPSENPIINHGGSIFTTSHGPNKENNPPFFNGPLENFKQNEIPEPFKNMENFLNHNNNNNNNGPSTSFSVENGSGSSNSNSGSSINPSIIDHPIIKPSFETNFPLTSGSGPMISNSLDSLSQPSIVPAPHIILNPNVNPFGGISLATASSGEGAQNFIQSLGDNDNEHGWTAATYKGWRPIAKPPTFYAERQNLNQNYIQNQNQNQNGHHHNNNNNHNNNHNHFTNQQSQPHSSPSQVFPVSFLPPSQSSSNNNNNNQHSTSTTEQYRDVGGKHKKLMLTTLFRDNVKSVKPQAPVKLKPDFEIIQSESHTTSSHSQSQTPPPTSTTVSHLNKNQNQNQHNNQQENQNQNKNQNNHFSDPGVMIPLPEEVGAGPGIRLPSNLFFDDFGSKHNSHLEFPSSFSTQNNHLRQQFSNENESNNGNSNPSGPPHNQVQSQSEDTPVRKPFPRFRTTTPAPFNDSSEAPNSNSNGNSNGNSFLNKIKFKRPKFQRPNFNNNNNNNQNGNSQKESQDDSDEMGPPKVTVPSSSESLDRPHLQKHKFNKQRQRIRGGNPNPLSNSNSNNNNNNGGNQNLKKPDAFVSAEEVGHALQGQGQRQGQSQGHGQRPYSSEETSTESFRSTTNGSSINFPPPPLYGGGYYGDGHPLAPPPTFFDSLNNPYLIDGSYAGPPVTVVPTNNHHSSQSHGHRQGHGQGHGHGHSQGTTGQSSENIVNTNTTPSIFQGERAGPSRKKKVRNQNTNELGKGKTPRPSTTVQTERPQHHHQPQPQQQHQQQPQHQQIINYKNPLVTNNLNVNTNNGVTSNEDGGPHYTPQGTFYFPSEFTEMANSGEHQAVSFMTMPGSRPHVINHFHQQQQQQQQQHLNSNQNFNHNQNGNFQHEPPQNHNQHHHHHNTVNKNKQPPHLNSYPINILRNPNFPPPPPGPGTHHLQPHHSRFPINSVSPSTPPFLQHSSAPPTGFPPTGPISAPNNHPPPHHHRPNFRQPPPPPTGHGHGHGHRHGPHPESTTIRNNIHQTNAPFTPNPNGHEVTFSGQYPHGHPNNFENHGEIYQRQPTNSYKFPVPAPPGQGHGQGHGQQGSFSHPFGPPPPPTGPGHRHGGPGPLPLPPPPGHNRGHSGPARPIHPNSINHQNQNQNLVPQGHVGHHGPSASSSEQYDRIPMEFLNELRPILIGEGESQISPVQATFMPSSTTLRSTSPMMASSGHMQHVHHSPNVHPPGQYFDDFFKPLQSHEHYRHPPPVSQSTPQSVAQSQEIANFASTERLPSTMTMTSPYPNRGGHVTNNNRPPGQIRFPSQHNQQQQHLDSHKSPSVNFEQFIRPSPQDIEFHGFPGQNYNEINLSKEPVYSVAPVHDFPIVTTISPILEQDLFFHAKKPKVWSKLKHAQIHTNEKANVKNVEFNFGYPISSTENLPLFSSQEPEDEVYILNPSNNHNHNQNQHQNEIKLKEQSPKEPQPFTPSLHYISSTTEHSSTRPKYNPPEIRATHRPVYQRPTPASATTVSKVSTSSAASLNEPETTLPSTSVSVAATTPHQNSGNNRITENSNESDNQKSSIFQNSMIGFDKIIPRNPFSDSSNEKENDSENEMENNNEDESNIPSSNGFRTRNNKMGLSTLKAIASTTTMAPLVMATTTEDQSETPSTTFTSKRYLKRRRPNHGHNQGQSHGHNGQLSRLHGGSNVGGMGGKRYFSSKVNQNISIISAADQSSAESQREHMRQNNPYIIRKHQLPKQHSSSSENKHNDLTSDPPVTTHRPHRRFKPTASLAATTAASQHHGGGGLSAEESVTQPFIYPKRKLLQKRIRNFPPAARLGLPAANKDNNNNDHHNHNHDTNHNDNDNDAHNLNLDLKRISKVKSVGAPVFNGASNNKAVDTTTVNSNSNPELSTTEKNSPFASSPSSTPSSAESAVTYGESQWFRIKNSFNEGHGHGHAEEAQASLKKINNHVNAQNNNHNSNNNNDVNNNEASQNHPQHENGPNKDRVIVTMSTSVSSSSEQHGSGGIINKSSGHRDRLVTPGHGHGTGHGQRRRFKQQQYRQQQQNQHSNDGQSTENVSFSPIYRKKNINNDLHSRIGTATPKPEFESLAGPSAEALTEILSSTEKFDRMIKQDEQLNRLHLNHESVEMLPEPAALLQRSSNQQFPGQTKSEEVLDLAQHLHPQQLYRPLVARPRFLNEEVPFSLVNPLSLTSTGVPGPVEASTLPSSTSTTQGQEVHSVANNSNNIHNNNNILIASTSPSSSIDTNTNSNST